VQLPKDKDEFIKMIEQEPKKIELRSMSDQEKLRLSFGLQRYHTVFKKFWEMATIVFTPELPTAAVCSTTGGKYVMMKINPDFWESRTPIQQLWVICHECLHAILDHFARGSLLEHHSLANKMMDVVINQATIEKFGFKRSEIDPNNEFCWYDTFFSPADNVLTGQSFEYYYKEIIKYPERYGNGRLLDEHNMISEEDFAKFIKEMSENLTPEQKESLKKWLQSQFSMGTGANPNGAGDGGAFALWKFEELGYVKKKKKWESVIKNWVLKTVGTFIKPKEQWVFQDRRMLLLPKTVYLPHVNDEEEKLKKKDKINLFFFLDTSGSCYGYGERFFRAARSIPTDRFNIFLFNFDTTVYEVDIEKAEVMGGGGTTFGIIEDKIQEVMKRDGLDYPRAVWIVTDGEGTTVKPQIPENWHWFMTEYFTDKYVDKKSQIYKLTDFE
jgi:transposase-like protein